MLRKWMFTIMLCLLVAGCTNSGLKPTAWVIGAPGIQSEPEENEITGRIGLEITPAPQEQPSEALGVALPGDIGNRIIEVGLQSSYLAEACQWYGAYGILHLTDEGDPATALGRPYIGYQFSMPWDAEDGSLYGPVLGTTYWDIFVLEGQYRDFAGQLSRELSGSDAWRVAAGVRIKF